MIKISKMVDYGVVILAHLAGADALQNTATIAAATHLPEPSVAQILKSLNKAGLVSSVRGAAGGYKIAHSADDVTVADIVVAMEGPIALTACVDVGEAACGLSSICAVSGRWTHVNTAIETALDNVTLRDMMAPQNQGASADRPQQDIQIEGRA